MNRLARPEALSRHLDEVAGAWREITGEDVDASVLGAFGRLEALARQWAALQREVLAPIGLNYAEVTTIGLLRTARPAALSPTDLRQRVGQSSAGMTRILDKLEADGLVRRVDLADDRRRVDVHLTRRGAELAEASFSALYAAVSAVLATLGKRRREAIASSLDALLEVFAARARAAPRTAGRRDLL